MKKTIVKIYKLFTKTVTVILVLLILLILFTTFTPVKSFQILRVMSGSMEPSIKTGSVVFIKYLPAERIAVGDIINFQNGKSITHRVVEVKKEGNEYIFITKGDTNNSSDINPVGASQVQGKVIFSIPYLGYLSFFMQTPGGFVLLVIIPAGLIVISEFLNIIKEHEKIIIAKMKKKENEDTNHVNIKQI